LIKILSLNKEKNMANQNKKLQKIIKNAVYIVLFVAVLYVSFWIVFNVEFEDMIRFSLFFILVFLTIDIFKKLMEEIIIKK